VVKIKKEDINIRVEYELTPIRHLAVQCPECKSWFKQGDICLDYISYSYQMKKDLYMFSNNLKNFLKNCVHCITNLI